jgi:hypothetical protein
VARVAAANAGTPEAVQPAIDALNAYRAQHLRFPLLWYAADLEAVAWCEVFHAYTHRATTSLCDACGLGFLRPRTRKGSYCPVCRCLNARQLDKVRRGPPTSGGTARVSCTSRRRSAFPRRQQYHQIWFGLSSGPCRSRPLRNSDGVTGG